MSKLIFRAEDIRRVVEHSIHAPAQGNIVYTKEQPKAPAVVLVHDQGVYLMSNGEPMDNIGRPTGNGNEGVRAYVAYAKGCDPSVQEFDDWWDTSRELVGGDDFAETLAWAQSILTMLDKGALSIVFNFSARQITLAALWPRVKKGVPSYGKQLPTV